MSVNLTSRVWLEESINVYLDQLQESNIFCLKPTCCKVMIDQISSSPELLGKAMQSRLKRERFVNNGETDTNVHKCPEK